MDQPEIAIVDYGVGNLRNVQRALEAAAGQETARIWVAARPAELKAADAIVLPGVGAFGDAVANLRAAGFEAPLLSAVAAGVPLLGICVGMQMLFDESEEMGRHAGLGIIEGRVVRFPACSAASDGGPIKVPQIGWNSLRQVQPGDPLLAGIAGGAYAYFVHSYYCAPATADCAVATTEYGVEYVSIVRQGCVWGIQCHPEKSHKVGLAILRNFVEVVTHDHLPGH